jgi:hypothetical protein
VVEKARGSGLRICSVTVLDSDGARYSESDRMGDNWIINTSLLILGRAFCEKIITSGLWLYRIMPRSTVVGWPLRDGRDPGARNDWVRCNAVFSNSTM